MEESQTNPTLQHRPSPPPPDSDSDTNITHSPLHSDHITLTSPPHSDHLTLTSPPHSEHITLSPPPDHSPDHSFASSVHTSPSHRSSIENEKPHSPEKPAQPAKVYRNVAEQPVAILNRVALDEPVPVVEKTDYRGGRVDSGGGGNGRRKFSPALSILKRAKREKAVKRVALGFRVLGLSFCLVSFAVMAADRNQGWAIDSFHRYIEFRYCMSVNVIGFLYSGAQVIDLSYNFATGKYISQHRQVRRCLDFAFDQIVAYLLISASSSAATRIDDWQSNWGRDKFPDMATASVAMSFLAFVAIALSSLVSGYALCTSNSL